MILHQEYQFFVELVYEQAEGDFQNRLQWILRDL
jgi:hypothetical protein